MGKVSKHKSIYVYIAHKSTSASRVH